MEGRQEERLRKGKLMLKTFENAAWKPTTINAF